MNEDTGENIKESFFWSILPFIISGFFVFMTVLMSNKDDNLLWLFYSVVGLCTFLWAKIATFGIRSHIRAIQLGIPLSQYQRDSLLTHLRRKIHLWMALTIVIWICTFLGAMFIIASAKQIKQTKQPSVSSSQISGQNSSKNNVVVPQSGKNVASESRTAPVQTGSRMKGWVESSQSHRRVQRLDDTILLLTPIPFVGMLLAVLCAIIFVAKGWWRSDRKSPFVWKLSVVAVVVCFVVPIQLMFMAGGAIQKAVRTEVNNCLNNLSSDSAVTINTEPAKNSEAVIRELATLSAIMAHHSHPTDRISVIITDGDTSLVLELARDSEIPDEYWVFYPGYQSSASNEIGRIRTNVFDDY
jgi:hypothetical protein